MVISSQNNSWDNVMYQYKCVVIRWLDGDTCNLDVDLGFDIHLKQRVRVFGINAPEIHTKNKAEKKRGLDALAFAESLCPVNSTIEVKSHKSNDEEKFGRWLADIKLQNGSDFASAMIEGGHATAYFGGKR